MYISSVSIQNYRCFGRGKIDFCPGVNVLIGENNAGKTAIISALGQVFNSGQRRRLQFHDIFQGITDFSAAPTIVISVTLQSHNDTARDRALVATWLTQLSDPWAATLTYESYLPQKDADEFMAEFSSPPTAESFYGRLREFIPKYVSRVFGGDPQNRMQAESDLMARFCYQYLDALRDVGADMHSGQNPLLRDMLRMVLDVGATAEEKSKFKTEFAQLAEGMHGHLRSRLKLGLLFDLVADTGASDGGRPDVEGALEEAELIAALRLIVERDGMRLPVPYNGLGYNNLVYIALTLAKLDFDAQAERSGDNAVVFPMLVVEEPEAHLHPALQYKLLKYLRRRIGKDISEETKSRQVFITTHSTQVTSACDLDEIICLTSPAAPGESPGVAYPGKVFDTSTADGAKSKGYVERFLDATKSSMLFAKSVILAEGTAEQLVLPQLAEICGKPIEENHISLVAVGGSTAKHFLPLFGACPPERQAFALRRRVACLADADPSRKEKSATRGGFRSCFPYLIDGDLSHYEYRRESPVLPMLRTLTAGSANIQIFTNTKTLEYDIAHANPKAQILVTEQQNGCEDLRAFCGSKDTVSSTLEEALGDDERAALMAIGSAEDALNARFASYYLKAVADDKGAHALELAYALRQAGEDSGLVVPKYVQDALEFVGSFTPEAADKLLDA